jgi:hypothetical protein
MSKIIKLNPKVMDLKQARDEFLLFKSTRQYVRLSQDDIKEVHEKASPVQKLQQMDKRAPRHLTPSKKGLKGVFEPGGYCKYTPGFFRAIFTAF